MQSIVALQQRARLYQQIRAFFDGLNYLEVDTPLLAVSTNTDIHIESITATVCRQTRFLQTSPEFAMKRLLSAGSGSIYQICHAFRDGEQGRQHHPEFTLLEWYSLGFDYRQLMAQLKALIGKLLNVEPGIQQTTYAECFQQQLDVDIFSATLEQLQAHVLSHIEGVDVQQLTRDDCLDLLISQVIAKRFSGFTFVYDYPASQASLARISADDVRVAERFELFYNDMELANGFSELTDATEQRKRFEADNAMRKSLGLDVYPVDQDFLEALQQGLPECAGVALGLDRLLMVISDAESIGEVMALNTLQ